MKEKILMILVVLTISVNICEGSEETEYSKNMKMNKEQASDMIYAFFRECAEQNLCHIPIETADEIIDSWFEDYWENLNHSQSKS